MESAETIWQLKPVRPGINTWEGNALLPAPQSNVAPGYLVTVNLLQAFEFGDTRLQKWIRFQTYNGNQYPICSKYKVKTATTVSENYIMFRLAEQYLIRAEANVRLNNLNNGIEDVNTIRNRAMLHDITVNTPAGLLTAIEAENRIEFCVEWGHRWFDLKRTERIDDVLGAIKPDTWNPNDKLWPVPNGQILINNALTQNPGY